MRGLVKAVADFEVKLDSSNALTHSILGIILFVAAAVRIYHLDFQSIWYDESASWFQSIQDFPDMIRAVAGDNYPPLHNIFLYVFILNVV